MTSPSSLLLLLLISALLLLLPSANALEETETDFFDDKGGVVLDRIIKRNESMFIFAIFHEQSEIYIPPAHQAF